jgi:hypothetical protein
VPARVQRLPNISGLSQADCRYLLRSLGFLVDLIQAFVRRNSQQETVVNLEISDMLPSYLNILNILIPNKTDI